MENLAIILPYKKDSRERERNYYFMKKRYKKLFPKSQLLVCGDNSNDIYSKSKAINNSVKHLRNNIKYLVIADTDMIINKSIIQQALPLLNKYGLILPYNQISKIDKKNSEKILKEKTTLNNYVDNNTIYEAIWKYNNKPNYLGGGGVQILKRETFEFLDGYNEFFKGWGHEDICFCIHLSLHYNIHKMNNIMYHLYHPFQETKDSKHKLLNRRLRKIHENVFNSSLSKNLKDNVFRLLKRPQKIDFLATEEHFAEHLLPLYHKLPEKHKGNFYTTQQATNVPWSTHDNRVEIIKKINSSNKERLLFLASLLTDIAEKINRPIGWINHGAGQTYDTAKWRYKDHNNLHLCICSNEHYYNYVLNNSKCRNIAIIGTPKLDKWYNYKKPKNDMPIIAISFHHDRQACSESMSAFPHFEEVLPQLFTQQKWKILGHGHPRMIDKLIKIYNQYNIEYTKDFDEVLRRADLYICDHMSTLYEFATVDNKPVVVLNAPWYRRDVEHGLRFWEHSDVGINCNNPEDLFDCIEEALEDKPEQQMLRQKCLNAVYKYRDGKCTDRAVDELIKLVNSREYIADVFEKLLTIKRNKPIHDSQQIPCKQITRIGNQIEKISSVRKRMLARKSRVLEGQNVI